MIVYRGKQQSVLYKGKALYFKATSIFCYCKTYQQRIFFIQHLYGGCGHRLQSQAIISHVFYWAVFLRHTHPAAAQQEQPKNNLNHSRFILRY